MTEYDAIASEDAKKRGMILAKAARYPLLVAARDIAFAIAKVKGTVTADDVGREMEKQGLGSLGPAAGSIFNDDRFEFSGEFLKSMRKNSHLRLLRVWRLK